MKLTRKRKRILIASFVAVALILMTVKLYPFIKLIQKLTHHFSMSSPEDRKELLAIVADGRKLKKSALEYKRIHGDLPYNGMGIPPSLITPGLTHPARNWYSPTFENGKLEMYYKIDWDAGVRLEYTDSGAERWVYDPGDGTSASQILP